MKAGFAFAIAAVAGSVALGAGEPKSGRIENPQTAADLIAFNQNVRVGVAIPGEGRINRREGILTRWELPIPVAVDKSITSNKVAEAIAYWHAATGLEFMQVDAKAEPRLVYRAATADELHTAIGLGLIYRTYSNNRAQRGVVKIGTEYAGCTTRCGNVYTHELGHVIGILSHMDGGGGVMAATNAGPNASTREINMLVQLYQLPHGVKIEPDGSWKVVR